MLIFGEPPSPADYSIQRCGRCATKVEDAWNVYLGALEVAEKSLTEETEKGEITKEYADAQQKKLRTWERSMSEAIKKRRSEHGTRDRSKQVNHLYVSLISCDGYELDADNGQTRSIHIIMTRCCYPRHLFD